ncbi:MAG TPA: hypothetical protein VD902_03275 [Symbiobacteriaceae bacterium]|nr:hypothetical protein [Symbiobacteriaceae bacterium]
MESVSLVWRGDLNDFDRFIQLQELFERLLGEFSPCETVATDTDSLLRVMGLRAAEGRFQLVLLYDLAPFEDAIRDELGRSPETAGACAVLSAWGATFGSEGEIAVLESEIAREISAILGEKPRLVMGLPEWHWAWNDLAASQF